VGAVRIWVMAARVRTLPAAVAPVLVGTSLALGANHFHPLAFVAALLGAIFIQVGTNLSNDYSDARRGAGEERAAEELHEGVARRDRCPTGTAFTLQDQPRHHGDIVALEYGRGARRTLRSRSDNGLVLWHSVDHHIEKRSNCQAEKTTSENENR